MDNSYVKSEEKESKLGEWILFFNVLLIFIWLLSMNYMHHLIPSPHTDGKNHSISWAYP